MKILKSLTVCLVILLFFSSWHKPENIKCAMAESGQSGEITEDEIKNEVFNQIDELDFGEFEDFYENEISVFLNETTLTEKIKEMISTGETISVSEIISIALGGVTDNITNVLKLVSLIVVIVGFGSFSSLLEGLSKNRSGISSIVNFFVLSIILALVASIIADFVNDTCFLLMQMKRVMEMIFPVLLSLLVTVGGSSSSRVLQPAVVILTGTIIEIMVFLTTTVTTIYLVLSVLSELSNEVKLNRLKGFVSSTYKCLVGFIFTIFMGYLSLSGITAGGTDGISIKTAKYAIKSYIPLVGGYVSDSYEIFRVCTVLVKNSIGVLGVIVLFVLVVRRVVNLIIYNLGFKLASGLAEPISSGKISSFLSSLSTIFNFLIAGIVSCFLLGCLTMVVMISSANIG